MQLNKIKLMLRLIIIKMIYKIKIKIDQQRLEEDNNQNEQKSITFFDEINLKNQELRIIIVIKKYLQKIRNQIAQELQFINHYHMIIVKKLRFNFLEPVIFLRKLNEKSLLLANEFLLQLENYLMHLLKRDYKIQDFGRQILINHFISQVICVLYSQYIYKIKRIENLQRKQLEIEFFQINSKLQILWLLLYLVCKIKYQHLTLFIRIIIAFQRINDDLNNLEIQEGAMIESLLNQIIFKYNYSVFNFKVIVNQWNATTLQTIIELSKQQHYRRQFLGGYFNRKNEKFSESINYMQQLLQSDLNKLELHQYQSYISCQGDLVSQSYRDRCVSIVNLLNQINQQFEKNKILMIISIKQANLTFQSINISLSIMLKQEKSQIYSDCVALLKNKEALENKVVDLQIKANRVQVLENEKQRHLEKIKGFNEASELTRKEIDNLEIN
ncbi:unnamed protein product [Paramecium pentaurelia]|uniref:Uncharacterized protein n=1 Tax=Paramecium pentaurelia TaxID=43138 RepID=A0A8S1SX92_9CILI|nr:unnamed protein product [Paramecium pentaurelia]